MSTARHESLPNHPAPHRARVRGSALAFGLLGGPLAWFVQLNVGYALASWPCFPRDRRLVDPVVPWSKAAMVVVLGLAVVVAVAAFLAASHAYQRTKDEIQGNQRHLLESGAGRTRFLALWGMIFGAGFALTTLVTGVAFIVLPRCAG